MRDGYLDLLGDEGDPRDRHDLTRELRAQGLTDVRRRVAGFAQFVSGRR